MILWFFRQGIPNSSVSLWNGSEEMLQFNIVLSKEAQQLMKDKKNLEVIGNADILNVCLESLSFITLEMLNVENQSYVLSSWKWALPIL